MNESFQHSLQMSEPLISVIVPVYNKAPYLPSTIESVVKQNYPNLEILIRNDGSTDESQRIIDTLPSKYSHLSFKTFSGENRGVSYTRNFLLERATSPIIATIDADDLMGEGFLRDALQAMRTHGARLVYSDVLVEGGHVDEWCPPPFDPYNIRYGNCLTSLTLFDRDLWVEGGKYDEGMPFNEDWAFFIRVAQQSRAFHKLPGKYFVYRQNDQGLYRQYVVDNESLNLASVMIANPDLYQVEEVLQSIGLLRDMPPHWKEKLAASSQKNPESYLPYVYLSIVAARTEPLDAQKALLERAIQLSNGEAWLPFFLLGELVEKAEPTQAAAYYHVTRTYRPDMGRIVNERITRLVS